jgi:hypothetical protein
MKVKRSAINGIALAIRDLEADKETKLPFKFAYGIAKNKARIEPEIKAIAEAEKAAFADYEKERLELCKSHSKKDDKGEALMIGSTFNIMDKPAFEREAITLREKHKEAFEKLDKFLSEEIEIDLYQIEQKDFPETISAGIMGRLIVLVKEDATK